MENDKNIFTTLKANISELIEEESDLSDSDGESQEDSLFILKDNYQGLESKDNTPGQTILYNEKNERPIQKNLDLRTVFLIENESNTELFCNPDLVEDIKKVKITLRIQSNGGEMSVNKKANKPVYNKRVWFSRRDITNILSLKNLTEQYRVTYDSNGQMFIVHREGIDLTKI